MSGHSSLQRFLFATGFLGLVVGFVAQWLIFEPGNFSDVAGPVYIPLLGEHGVYTSRYLRAAWYGGVGLFLVAGLGGLIYRIIVRRRGR